MTPLRTIRVLLLGALSIGLAGTLAELVLTRHCEDSWQVVPVVLVAAALGVLGWHAAQPSSANVAALQVLMACIVVVGGIGVGLHANGSAAFQLEIDPSQDLWTLFTKVIRAKAPPVLAPGLMTQLGLVGFIYLYCHRAAGTLEDHSLGRSESS